ncbi:MAG: signal peptidase I [Patescibacteria group bacterium]
MDKVYKILSYIFFTAVVVIVLILISSALPIPGGFKTLVVQSGSMEPAIKTGSVVLVKPASSYQVGDVITFGPVSKTKLPTTHRIVEIRQENNRNVYLTKGDANSSTDIREVRIRDIMGKVLFSVPYVGYAVAAAKTKVGFVIIICIPALFIVWDQLKKIWQEYKKLRKKDITTEPDNQAT